MEGSERVYMVAKMAMTTNSHEDGLAGYTPVITLFWMRETINKHKKENEERSPKQTKDTLWKPAGECVTINIKNNATKYQIELFSFVTEDYIEHLVFMYFLNTIIY